MIEFDLELKQVSDNSFRFKVNNCYDLVFSEDKIMKLYEKGLLYEMDRGVVSLRLKEPLELEKTFERYLTIIKDL